MENKEKKQMLTTELTKEKGGRSAGMIQDMSINGIKLHLAQNGTGGPVIFWGMYPHQQNEVEHLWKSLLELVPEQNFLLVAFQVEDWNRAGTGTFHRGKQRLYSERKASPDKV